ncbi:hypothetical protein K438DRAFT_832254 [Mycena galopus ATCC 62051]|nr:hypothetical protein K438DRAFT_832254 [Mycena galopus ATCC 62051]
MCLCRLGIWLSSNILILCFGPSRVAEELMRKDRRSLWLKSGQTDITRLVSLAFPHNYFACLPSEIPHSRLITSRPRLTY